MGRKKNNTAVMVLSLAVIACIFALAGYPLAVFCYCCPVFSLPFNGAGAILGAGAFLWAQMLEKAIEKGDVVEEHPELVKKAKLAGLIAMAFNLMILVYSLGMYVREVLLQSQ